MNGHAPYLRRSKTGTVDPPEQVRSKARPFGMRPSQVPVTGTAPSHLQRLPRSAGSQTGTASPPEQVRSKARPFGMRPSQVPVTGTAPSHLQRLPRSAGSQSVFSLLAQQARESAPMTVGDVSRSLGAGRPLDAAAREPTESAAGADLGDVRIHEGAAADELCNTFSARAFTLGTDIVIAGGEYSPGTAEGERLLTHELTHVVQQGVRRAPPGQRLEVGAVADPAEREAETMAGSAAAREGAPSVSAAQVGTVQRVPRPLPSGAPISELNLDAEQVIGALWTLSQATWRTGVVDWNTHKISREIREIFGDNTFRGTNYWTSGWEDDGFNDWWDLGVVDTDIMVELTLMIDNPRLATSGEGEFRSSGETEHRTKTSDETTESGDMSGKAGEEKGPGAEAKISVEHKSGTEQEMSVKGSGDVTVKMGANVFRADAWVRITLSYDPTFFARVTLPPKLVKVGDLTYAAPAAGAPAGPK
jgi:Domain of unknown function (DUF4157)